MEKYHRLVKSGRKPLIIDCGGNIGLASLWFAAHYPQAQVVVIEPDSGNLELLKLNIAAFGDRITILPGAIWSRSASLKIVNPSAGYAAFRVSEVKDDTELANSIRGYTVKEIMEYTGGEYPFIVKLDIEGSQSELFRNNTEWVEKTALIILELDDWLFPWQGTSRSFFACVSNYPFEYLISGENIFCFLNR